MRHLLLSIGVIGNVLGAWSELCQEDKDVDVEIMVYAGMPNPHILLTGEQQRDFCAIVQSVNSRSGVLAVPTLTVVGFTGWHACVDDTCALFRGVSAVDEVLLQAAHTQLSEEHRWILEPIQMEVDRLDKNGGDVVPPEEHFNVSSSASCGGVRGSDDAKKIHFDPKHDCNGCFVTKQALNNCYNYGTDIITNTFSQPGGHAAMPITCQGVAAGAVSDGLIRRKQADAPTKLPTQGHYVGLFVAQSDFHWYRQDADLHWSHKPGKTPVTNRGNNGQIITAPHKDGYHGYTFCGYFRAIPSKMKIRIQSEAGANTSAAIVV